MGTDIHSIIEFQNEDGWHDISDGEWYLQRDYNFFGAISGIRGNRVVNPIQPKGLPENYSSELRRLIAYEVVDKKEYLSLDTVLRKDAESWMQSGKSSYCGSPGFEKTYILDPDLQTFGWLIISELKECIVAYKQVEKELHTDISILLDVMDVLAKYYGVDNVRFVFWFDN